MPDVKIQVIYDEKTDDFQLLTELCDEIIVTIKFDDFHKTLKAPLCSDNEMQMGRMVYALFS